MKLLSIWGFTLSLFVLGTCALVSKPRFSPSLRINARTGNNLQDIVTWDQHSLFVDGERLMIFSGEVHPFRLPVASLWLDLFQKIKALGFNAVSFYSDWAVLEGNEGHFTAENVFAYEPFFDAAMEAGIYLIARPGPHINGEASGGGFPGWLARLKGHLRTRSPDYLNATALYVQKMGEIIAKAQITNGGPIILVQPENEYTGYTEGIYEWPDPVYMQSLEDSLRAAGIVVPFISNDAVSTSVGPFAPGTGIGQTDLYGHDAYPMGFACGSPSTWPANKIPTVLTTINQKLHAQSSPWGPNSLPEFQGGAYDPWGGWGSDACATLLNQNFERVQYKNVFASTVTIFNVYMIYGGTNWGNIGHPGGYTSYDYGAAITENRIITREKYSELKLEGNFIKVSSDYLTGSPGVLSTTAYTNLATLAVTPVFGNSSFSNTSFWVVRHADYTSTDLTEYKITVNTTAGILTLPQLAGTLTLDGRDSKIHVTDYNFAGGHLLYSTAEIFTWQEFNNKKVMILYGGLEETHELAITANAKEQILEGSSSGVQTKLSNSTLIINWMVSNNRTVIEVGNTVLYLLDRNSAYDYWVPELGSGQSIIVKAGYLVRSASLEGASLHISADFNASTPIEIIGSPANAKSLVINGVPHIIQKTTAGAWVSKFSYIEPKVNLPDLKTINWRYIDSLPEVQSTYDDHLWLNADHKSSNNPRNLTTPTCLYSSDYGFHYGTLIYRGHFIASGFEKSLSIGTQGGAAYGSSMFLNDTFLGSWTGNDKTSAYNATLTIPNLVKGKQYALTVVIDTMGMEENYRVGLDVMKTPRGILNYNLAGSSTSNTSTSTNVTWKVTGNLGGEQYADQIRGPLNEGGMYAERQGFHQPLPPSQNWQSKSPSDGISKAGIGWFTTNFELDLPAGYDIPLVFSIANNTINGTVPNFRAQIYINGYQFGKYVSNIGPQKAFPVPQGILNYHGENWVALSLWALDAGGASLDISLETDPHVEVPIVTSMQAVQSVPQPAWKQRQGGY